MKPQLIIELEKELNFEIKYKADNNNNVFSLMLNNCGISDITFINKFPKLKELNLGKNNISNLSVLSEQTELEILNLYQYV